MKDSRRPLRVGILVDSLVQPRWVHEVLKQISTLDEAELVLVVENGFQPVRKSFFRRLAGIRRWSKTLLYILYRKFDDWKFAAPHDAFEPLDVGSLVSDCSRLTVRADRKKYSDLFPDSDVQTIRSHDLDVLLRFGFRILKGDILKAAKHGVWSHHHGDNLINRGGPAGFWEVMENQPATGTVLQVLNEQLDAGQVIHRTFTATDPHSVRRSRSRFYRKATSAIPQKLKQLYQLGSVALCEQRPSAYLPYSNRLYKIPTNGQMVRLAARFFRNYLGDKIGHWLRRGQREQWFLAYHLDKSQQTPDESFYRFKSLYPPADRFWADPFVTTHDDKHYVFFEDLPFDTKKGHISVIEFDSEGKPGESRTALKQDYHLSYPFLFEWNGQHYMIPETAARNEVQLFEAVEFPDKWRLKKVLLRDIYAVDATLWQKDGAWWMFVNQTSHEELHLYHAPTPLGPWTPHRRNPIKCDVRGSRPAGRLFEKNGELFRPAQDCTHRYGYAISIHRVSRLDKNEYEEHEVGKIFPRWQKGLLATHTLNHQSGMTVVDGQRWLKRAA